ncbi:MAG TPA: NYN domain-containing protein [Patescibacteria group bacterium]|nr:NYN domain-containing protein [Patescibacteria group bacterium]
MATIHKLKKKKNYAFIDSQNLNLGITSLGWKLDFRKFKVYLKEKYNVSKAYLFIGYMPENQGLYKSLQEYGFVLVFKPVLKDKKGEVKGNVDADLVLQAMIDYLEYDKAVVVTSDGDFYSLIGYLYGKSKLELVLSPNRDKCSVLLKRKAKEKIEFMNSLKTKLKYTARK